MNDFFNIVSALYKFSQHTSTNVINYIGSLKYQIAVFITALSMVNLRYQYYIILFIILLLIVIIYS